MEHSNTKYKSLTFREHVRLRPDMYIGGNTSTENTLWVYTDGELVKKTLSYPAALYNICDEIILNAIDHCSRTSKLRGHGKCNAISLSVWEHEDKTYVSCWNNGEGIVVEKVDGMYVPEMIFTKEMSGSNFDNTSAEKIGMNGIGSKATNIMSSEFTVETLDAKNKLLYRQVVTEGNLHIGKPEITKSTGKPYTKITFQPDHAYFGMASSEMLNILTILLKTRMLYVSAYLGKKYEVCFNEEKIEVNGLGQLANMVSGIESIHKCPMTSTTGNPMDVYLGIYEGDSTQEHLTFLNGLYLSDGGTHVRVVLKLLLEALRPKLEKKLKGKIPINTKLLSQHIMVFLSGNMGNLTYKNQSKNELHIPESRFKGYELDKRGVATAWSALEARIDAVYLNKVMTTSTTRKVGDLKGIPKYRSADYAGTSKSAQCCLFIPEGDSAESCIKNGLTSNKSLGFKFNGMFNIQGVPLNVRKAVDVREVTIGGKRVRVVDRKKEIDNNERIRSLVKVLNLNYHMKYDSAQERQTLRYGSVIIATDADVDGLGNICGLILNFFDLFFPELLKQGFVKLLATPLVRAYPKKKGFHIEEFYTAEEFDKWCEVHDVGDYHINYIKGLATHSNVEIGHMFKQMEKNVYQFQHDPDASDRFEIYFGKETQLRKDELSNKPAVDETKSMKNRMKNVITCSDHLMVNTREYQLDNIQRKIPHEIDGLNPARRKVLCGSIMKFKQKNSKIKVFQLGGYVAEKMLYHHGSASLNETIINMAQNFPGSRNIPLLLPIGQFGTHYKGGKDAGSPRYIDTKLNESVVSLMYPREDMDLLEWLVVDGEMAEPKYFVPILPMAILENIEIPATGWKVEIWGRDVDAVYKNVLKIIDGDNSLDKMPYWLNKFSGACMEDDSTRTIFVGDYDIEQASSVASKGFRVFKIKIKSLPPRMWIDPLVEKLSEMEDIKVRDNSTIEKVDIQVTVPESVMASWCGKSKNIPGVDYVQQGLGIYSIVKHHINLYTREDTVKECSSYEEVIVGWADVRRELYKARVLRETILLKCRLIMLQNSYKFIQQHVSMKLSSVDEEKQVEVLAKKGYVPVNITVLNAPKQIPNDILEDSIMNKGASYNYLLNLSYRQMTKQSLATTQNKISETEKRLQYLSDKDVYKKIWKEELSALMKVIHHGLEHGFYQEDASLFKNA